MTGQTSTLDEPESSPRRREQVPTVRVLWSDGQIREEPSIDVVGSLRIGRDPDSCGCVLVDPYVSRQHAVVEADARRSSATLRNLSRRGSQLGATTVQTEHPLEDGDVFFTGRTALLFRWELRPVEDAPSITRLLGSAPSMRALRAKLALLAPTDSVVSIHGETGTGKELVAQTLHELSGRDGAFVPVNCAAIPDTLAEAALFGHVGGAFTGATTNAKGYFRAAAGGTLFLDELGELPLTQQAKLLRAIESGRVVPVGATEEIEHGARVVAATHRDLTQDVRESRFRADLYARVSDFVLDVPALADRPEDVLPLLRHGYDEPMPPLEPDLVRALLDHPWPLNVRELMRTAAQLRTFGAGQATLGLHLVKASLERTASLLPEIESSGGDDAREARTSDRPPSRDMLERLLREHRGVVADVARATGRSRKQVYRWARSHGLTLEDYRDG